MARQAHGAEVERKGTGRGRETDKGGTRKGQNRGRKVDGRGQGAAGWATGGTRRDREGAGERTWRLSRVEDKAQAELTDSIL